MNSNMNFLKGVGMGLVIGAAAGAVMAPKKKCRANSMVCKAVKSVSEVVDGIADSLGL